MNYSEYKNLISSDLYRYIGKVSFFSFIKLLLIGEGFNYTFWMRTCNYTKQHSLLKFTCYPIARWRFQNARYKFGISIPFATNIDKGFYIGHIGNIVVNAKCKIGKNCNISQGVTLGQANRGKNKGTPIIGNNVYIGPGAKVVGAVEIGNNVAIGANCVVTKNIPDNSVVVGIPGKIISTNGSSSYINKIDY